MSHWTVTAPEAGVRLDKFLAGADRIGSRVRAATALERGKIFLNEREMTPDQAGTRLAAGDVVRAWMDRPGSAKRRATLGDSRDLPIVYEDDTLVVLDKPAGLLAVPLPLRRRENARSVFDDLRSTCAAAAAAGRSSSTASIATPRAWSSLRSQPPRRIT